jgi:hypothetical protein
LSVESKDTRAQVAVADLILVRPMIRSSISVALLALLAGCASQFGEVKRVMIIDGQACCAKHRVPLITVRGFQAPSGVLVHNADPRSDVCDQRTPNRLWDSRRLLRTSIHPVPAPVTYCPRCEAEYTECMASYQLTVTDIQQIRDLVSRRSDIRKPILRIVAVDTNRAFVDAGRENRVGDIFVDFGVTKHHGKWRISSSIDSHRLLAVAH